MDQIPIPPQGGADQGVFVDRYTHALDPKKRITIPAGWRDQIGKPESVYVLPNIESKCLTVFASRDFARRIQKFRDHSVYDTRARRLGRALASRSDLLDWDVQGRIRIKDALLDFAGIVNDAVLVGALDFFEIWSPERYEAADKQDDNSTLLEAARYVGL